MLNKYLPQYTRGTRRTFHNPQHSPQNHWGTYSHQMQVEEQGPTNTYCTIPSLVVKIPGTSTRNTPIGHVRQDACPAFRLVQLTASKKKKIQFDPEHKSTRYRSCIEEIQELFGKDRLSCISLVEHIMPSSFILKFCFFRAQLLTEKFHWPCKYHMRRDFSLYLMVRDKVARKASQKGGVQLQD